MKNLTTITALFLFTCFLLVSSCDGDGGDDDPKKDTTVYDYELTQAFKDIDPVFDNQPEDNVATNEGVELGRHLFYDPRLSKNNTISCASCHKQEMAFTDGERFSLGFNGERTARNSMAIANMRWHGLFFWDGRAPTLEEQVLMPIQDPVEMGMTLEEVEDKLKDIDIYPDMFESAFGSKEITSDRVSKALSQFVRSIMSQGSKYDQIYGLPDSRIKNIFTDEEYLGFTLFKTHIDPDYGAGINKPGTANRGANCGDCHHTALLTNNLFTSNGLDSITKDEGYGPISGKEKYDGTFKTPTLRNIELTAPYMHDGRFQTLEEVLDHYDQHVQDHPNLDIQIAEAGNIYPGRLDLTNKEKNAIIAFLKTLTDYDLIENPKYSNPFDE